MGHFRVHSLDRSLCLLCNAQVGETPTGWCTILDPTGPTKAFCTWVDTEYLLLGCGGAKMRNVLVVKIFIKEKMTKYFKTRPK